MKEKKGMHFLIGFLGCIVLILFDQYTKSLAVNHLKDKGPLILIDKVLQLRYLENRGAAFGMLQNQKTFFLITGIIVIAGICFLYFKMPSDKKYNPLRFVAVLMTAGALGNMIDRYLAGYVVDFFYFELIDFPIFNVADCYVTISAALLIIFFLFLYSEKDLDFISSKKKAESEHSNEGEDRSNE